MDDASHEAGGQSDAEAFGGGNRHQHRDEGKTGSLHDRQAGSDRANANRLEERGDTRKEHGHLDEIDLFGAPEGKACGTGNNDGRSDVGGEHRQHMLQAKRYRFRQRWGDVRVRVPRLCLVGHVSRFSFAIVPVPAPAS